MSLIPRQTWGRKALSLTIRSTNNFTNILLFFSNLLYLTVLYVLGFVYVISGAFVLGIPSLDSLSICKKKKQ